MKYLDEFRDPDLAASLLDEIAGIVTERRVLMEVCGGQTHSIIRNGIDRLLPDEIEMVHGPGCPVCVTPLETIDRALAIASRDDVTFCSFGDMLRVPGSGRDLFSVKSLGGDIRGNSGRRPLRTCQRSVCSRSAITLSDNFRDYGVWIDLRSGSGVSGQ